MIEEITIKYSCCKAEYSIYNRNPNLSIRELANTVIEQLDKIHDKEHPDCELNHD